MLRLRARGRAARAGRGGARSGRAGHARDRRRLDQADARASARRDPRFVGGHPIAGAETAGVEHARADLFQGAAWYLTPREQLRRRPLRAPAPASWRRSARARWRSTPSARPPARHRQPPAARARERARRAGRRARCRARTSALPRVGPSFRDTTRVAGANTAIWTDIYLPTATRSPTRSTPRSRACRRCARCCAPATPAPCGLERRARATTAARLLEADLAGGPVHELRVTVPNRPGIVAAAGARARQGGVNIVDMALAPGARQPRRARSTFWVAGDESAERAARADGGLGFPVVRAVSAAARFDPGRPARGATSRRPRTSRSRTAPRCSRRCATSPSRSRNYLDSEDTHSTLDAVQALGAAVRGRAARRARDPRRRPARAAEAPAGRSTSATRARCCACCRAGSPARPAARGRSTATSRSAAGRSTAWPSRCG